MIPDQLDKKILQKMSKGINSYNELAKECNVTRSTIYRRVALLEKNGLLLRITRSAVDYEKLELVTLCLTLKVAFNSQEKVLNALKEHESVKFLWRAYGEYNIVAVAFCSKGTEGEIIAEIRGILEKWAGVDMKVSVGFAWEKMEFTPFNEEAHQETQTLLIAQKTNKQPLPRFKNRSHVN